MRALMNLSKKQRSKLRNHSFEFSTGKFGINFNGKSCCTEVQGYKKSKDELRKDRGLRKHVRRELKEYIFKGGHK